MMELAKENTRGKQGAVEKAYALYDYVFHTLRYDKSGTGWGRGDSLWACDAKHGNCTDFHSLFISMLRAEKIPARFEIGFPLPTDTRQGEIPGYHCWAEFYVDGPGWIPVDISEAWKDQSKHDYFFGTLDANRVQFTIGRDITLTPKQEGPPLNYFVYPYVEVDGQPYEKLGKKFAFRESTPAGTAAAGR
jgi:transglutaminase-like putative cysteine protease